MIIKDLRIAEDDELRHLWGENMALMYFRQIQITRDRHQRWINDQYPKGYAPAVA